MLMVTLDEAPVLSKPMPIVPPPNPVQLSALLEPHLISDAPIPPSDTNHTFWPLIVAARVGASEIPSGQIMATLPTAFAAAIAAAHAALSSVVLSALTPYDAAAISTARPMLSSTAAPHARMSALFGLFA